MPQSSISMAEQRLEKIIAELIQAHRERNTSKPYEIRALRCFCFVERRHRQRDGSI